MTSDQIGLLTILMAGLIYHAGQQHDHIRVAPWRSCWGRSYEDQQWTMIVTLASGTQPLPQHAW